MTTIRYTHSDDAWNGFKNAVRTSIERAQAKTVVEIGAGANPTFSPSELTDSISSYTLLDISESELGKAPRGYRTLVADMSSTSLKACGTYDFAFSKMLAEHLPSGEVFHRNVYKLLAPGGRAFHFFPTLFAPPFVANRAIPEAFAEWLLRRLQPERMRTGRNDKFPAYYSWCFGPAKRQIRRLESVGFVVEEYIGFFGHAAYYNRIPIIKAAHKALTRTLIRYPVAALTSFAYVVVRKPA